MIKILNPNDVPRMTTRASMVRALMEEALAALEKNPTKIILVSRDDGKPLSTEALKKYMPEGFRAFNRQKSVYIKKETV